MDVAGLVFGALPVAAQLFQSTLLLYSQYSEAKDLGKTSIKYRTFIRIERYRYENLGTYVGLSKGNLTAKLQASYLDLILDILANIAQALLATQKLEKKYLDNTGPPKPTSAKSLSTAGPEPFDPIITRRLELHAVLAQEVKERVSLVSSFKFAVWDKNKLEHFITDLKNLNDGLERVTGYHPQLQGQLMVQMLDVQSVQTLSALGTATEVVYPTLSEMAKRKAAYIEIQGRQLQQQKSGIPLRVDNSPELKLRYSEILLRKENHPSGREFGTYKGIPVMVEWKILSDELSHDQSLCRIQDMARFLSKNNPNQDDTLSHLLGCLGYSVKPGQTDRVALVYQTSETTHITLQEMLKDTNHADFNLGARFRLALSLAECVFYLHLTGWLHKGIRSSNIIISGDTPQNQTRALRLHLAGFDAARLDGAPTTETSEKVEIDAYADLYQHPEYQASNKDKTRYKRQYDIFSLGLILLELGTWQLIESSGDFRKKKYDPKRFLKKLLGGPVASLSFTMGNAYKRAVVWCLQGQFGMKDQESGFDSLTDSEKSRIFWENVVLELVKGSVEE